MDLQIPTTLPDWILGNSTWKDGSSKRRNYKLKVNTMNLLWSTRMPKGKPGGREPRSCAQVSNELTCQKSWAWYISWLATNIAGNLQWQIPLNLSYVVSTVKDSESFKMFDNFWHHWLGPRESIEPHSFETILKHWWSYWLGYWPPLA